MTPTLLEGPNRSLDGGKIWANNFPMKREKPKKRARWQRRPARIKNKSVMDLAGSLQRKGRKTVPVEQLSR